MMLDNLTNGVNEPNASNAPAPTPALEYASSSLQSQTKMIRIETFTSSVEADLACAKLQSEGIQCFVGGQSLLGGIAGYGLAFNKFDLNVTAGDEADARAILDAIKVARASQHSVDDPSVRCPACQSATVRHSRPFTAMMVILFIAGFCATAITANIQWLIISAVAVGYSIFTSQADKWVCASCGHEWQQPARRDEEPPAPSSDG